MSYAGHPWVTLLKNISGIEELPFLSEEITEAMFTNC